MNFEKIDNREVMGHNREKLLKLERDGRYVFHGSTEIIGILEPRQAYNKNQETGEMEKDGDPAIFATPYADVAIFRALVNNQRINAKSSSKFGMNDNGLHFSATKNLMENAESAIGRVYVLDKAQFRSAKGTECRSEENIVPIEVIDVSFQDLPPNINILDI